MDFEDKVEDTHDDRILMGTYTIPFDGYYCVDGKTSYYNRDDEIKMYDKLVNIARVKWGVIDEK